MARVNAQGYVERASLGMRGKGRRGVWRDWWLVKAQTSGNSYEGGLSIKPISLPQKYVGKRIRLKVEVL